MSISRQNAEIKFKDISFTERLRKVKKLTSTNNCQVYLYKDKSMDENVVIK